MGGGGQWHHGPLPLAPPVRNYIWHIQENVSTRITGSCKLLKHSTPLPFGVFSDNSSPRFELNPAASQTPNYSLRHDSIILKSDFLQDYWTKSGGVFTDW